MSDELKVIYWHEPSFHWQCELGFFILTQPFWLKKNSDVQAATKGLSRIS